MTFALRLDAVRDEIAAACAACDRDPAGVELLAVSKRHPSASIREAMTAGLDTFGESRVQELADKAEELEEAGIAWHLIGSLQTNKVNQLLRVPGLALVQSLDRVKLADALQSALAETPRTLEVLIQINATEDATKKGAAPADTEALLQHVVTDCPALRPVGVMAMGPLHGDPGPVFQTVANLHDSLRQTTGLPLPTRSMGMTGDLESAIAHSSTMVRIGTALFQLGV